MTTGRNAPCPCGSGLKFKKCCLPKEEARAEERTLLAGGAAGGAGIGPGRHHPGPPSSEAIPVGGGLDITPYAIAKITEDPRLDADPRIRKARKQARGEFWTISKVAAMTTEAIEQQLLAYGVRHTRDRFLELSEGRYSAWAISEAWKKTDPINCVGKQVDFLGLAACELWKRWIPDRPSVEMLDDWMQDGYVHVQRGQTVTACRLWWRVWRALVPRFTPAMRRMQQAEPVFGGVQCIYNWAQDFEMELGNAALHDPAFASSGRQFCEEWIAQFPGDEDLIQRNFRRALGAFLLQLGQGKEALAVLEGTVRRGPDDIWGYVALAEAHAQIRPPRQSAVPLDLDRAVEYLDRASAVAAGREDREAVAQRLAEVRKRAEEKALDRGGR